MQEQAVSRDQNLVEVKNTISYILPGSRIILFGSRGRGDYDCKSDYDIIVVSDKNLDVKAKRRYAGLIRKNLAALGIPADVLVKTETDIFYYKDKIGSVVRDAISNGIAL
jgi:predicted nucleotidyltransferase